MRRWRCASESETRELGARLADELAPDGVLLLSGCLGAGKTVLAQGVAAGLGLDPSAVQSPSYTLIAIHEGDPHTLVHVDLYRLDPGEVHAIGLDEQLAGPGVKVVEWAERLPERPRPALTLRIERAGEDGAREILEVDSE